MGTFYHCNTVSVKNKDIFVVIRKSPWKYPLKPTVTCNYAIYTNISFDFSALNIQIFIEIEIKVMQNEYIVFIFSSSWIGT